MSVATDDHNLFSLQTGLTLAINQYSDRPTLKLAVRITGQLLSILDHPHMDLFPDERRVYARLLRKWQLRIQPANADNVIPLAAR